MSNKCYYSEDQYKRERSEKIATVLAIVLSLVPWGIGVPVAYRWSLWGLSLVSVLYLVLTFIPTLNRLGDVQKWSVGIGVMAFCLAFFWPPIKQQWRAEQAAKVEGDIKISTGTAAQPRFSFGDSGTIFQYSQDLEKINPNYEAVHILYDAGLRLEIDDGIIKVSTLVRDRQGRLVASIDKNHWSVTSACLDKNYSSDSLEILDARGLVVFQMRLLPDHVQLAGEWRDEFGNGTRISGQGGGHISSWHDPNGEQRVMEILKPVFQYPSINHWGERVTQP